MCKRKTNKRQLRSFQRGDKAFYNADWWDFLQEKNIKVLIDAAFLRDKIVAEYCVRFVDMYGHSGFVQHSCEHLCVGVGATVEEAFDRLIEASSGRYIKFGDKIVQFPIVYKE